MNKLNWKKLLLQVLTLVATAFTTGSIAVATVANDAVPSFLVAEQAPTEKAIKWPTVKPGNDYALTINLELTTQRGTPGQKCYVESVEMVLRTNGALPPYKAVKSEVVRIVNAAFSNICPESDINVLVGGAMPKNYYGEEMAVIRVQDKAQDQLPPSK